MYWPFFYDWTYILLIPALILSMWAQFRVSSTFSRFSKVRASSGMTATQMAEQLLHAEGVYDVSVERTRGNLTDHYDPRNMVLRLSDSTANSTSVAALGVAAHEAGHVLQHRDGYAPLMLRTAAVPVVNIGSNLSWPLFLVGLIFSWEPLLYAGIRKNKLITWAVTLVLALALHLSGLDAQLIGVHLLEFLFGITVVGAKRPRIPVVVGAALVWPVLWAVSKVAVLDAKLLCAVVSAAVFVVLSAWPKAASPAWLQRTCALAGKYSYAVFLVHHFIILQLVQKFDLAALTRRDTALLFGAYLVITAAASWGLYRLDVRVRAAAGRLFAR